MHRVDTYDRVAAWHVGMNGLWCPGILVQLHVWGRQRRRRRCWGDLNPTGQFFALPLQETVQLTLAHAATVRLVIPLRLGVILRKKLIIAILWGRWW